MATRVHVYMYMLLKKWLNMYMCTYSRNGYTCTYVHVIEEMATHVHITCMYISFKKWIHMYMSFRKWIDTFMYVYMFIANVKYM